MFAVVGIKGIQYLVSPGDSFSVAKQDKDVGENIIIKDVLLVSDGEKLAIGTPYLNDTEVKAKILSHGHDDKINVRRFRAKSRHRRSIGFRKELTTIEITSIDKTEKKETKPKKF